MVLDEDVHARKHRENTEELWPRRLLAFSPTGSRISNVHFSWTWQCVCLSRHVGDNEGIIKVEVYRDTSWSEGPLGVPFV